MVRAGALLVAAVALLAVVPAAQAGERQAAIGISASLRYLDGDDLRDTVARLREAGIRYSREDLEWADVERTPGRYDWSSYDRLVRAAARGGLRLIAIPIGSPAWATGEDGRPPASGAALERYAAFVRAAVARYGTRGLFWLVNPLLPRAPITLWDIWNEPYERSFWRGTPSAKAYAAMFRRVVSVARGADPAARFMLEADTGSNTGSWPQPPYLGALFEAVPDLASYADIVSIHPYTSELKPTRCTPDDGDDGIRESWKGTRFQFCRVRDVRRILDAYGARDTRVWITELGWPTAPDDERSVTEAEQAAYLGAAFRLLRRWRLVDGVVLYHLQTFEQDPADGADWYGLLRPDGSPKPAWDTFVEEIRDGLPAPR